jgi:hypothetical protein
METAGRLFVEREESERRRREVQQRNEAQSAAQAALNPVGKGIPAGSIPDGVAPAAAMLQAAKDAGPRRQSVLEHALANTGGVFEFHPLGPAPE